MRIAIASGKGGTGKTLFATHLAWIMAERAHQVAYVDADVEEPNGHLLLKPNLTWEEPCLVPMPAMQRFRCSRCNQCVDACAFHAVVLGGGGPLFFPQLCHGCGNCIRVCPEAALVERQRAIGTIQGGHAGRVSFLSGTLQVGEPRAVPLISALWVQIEKTAGTVIVDCPPGTSCAAMAAVRPADLVLLVTEPTPFGWHDLQLSLEMCRALGRPAAVLINRCDLGGDPLREWLERQGVRVISELPFCPQVAEANAAGGMALEQSPRFRDVLEVLADALADSSGWGPARRSAAGSPQDPRTTVTSSVPPQAISDHRRS